MTSSTAVRTGCRRGRSAASSSTVSGAAGRGACNAEAREAGVDSSTVDTMPRSRAAAPPTTGRCSTMSWSLTSAMITVTLSGPPPRRASWTSRSTHCAGSAYSRRDCAMVSALTTPDSPSLQIR
jgi:hypothetical protein